MNKLRFRIWPETRVGLTLAGKKPGPKMIPQVDEVMFVEQPNREMRPYDRLIGAALADEGWLFARQDTVEAAWNVVNGVLDDATPVYPYAKARGGPIRPIARLPSQTWFPVGAN